MGYFSFYIYIVLDKLVSRGWLRENIEEKAERHGIVPRSIKFPIRQRLCTTKCSRKGKNF